MKLKGKEIIIGIEFGDNEIAMNKKTFDSLGNVPGYRQILATKIGDGLIACNKYTYDKLQKSSLTEDKAPKSEDIEEKVVDDEEEEKYTEVELFKLNKDAQIVILKELGLTSSEIRALRYEEERVFKILELQ
jgi:hypothetical protein